MYHVFSDVYHVFAVDGPVELADLEKVQTTTGKVRLDTVGVTRFGAPAPSAYRLDACQTRGVDFLLLKTLKSVILALGPSGIRGCRVIIGVMEIDDPDSIRKSDYMEKSSSKSHVIRISEVVHITPLEAFHKHSQFPTIYHFERSGRRKI